MQRQFPAGINVRARKRQQCFVTSYNETKARETKKNVNVLSAKQPLDGRNGLENGFLWDTSVNVYS